jgi:type IV secretion system protein VirD4
MLDEFPALGRLDFFESALAFMAGYGMKVFLIAQSLNQIEKAYGPNNAILDNCHVRVCFATNDERTARRVSDALGTATELRAMKNYAGHRLSPWLGHLMVSRQETARPLLTPGEVMQLPPAEELVLVSGAPPIRARKVRYFEDRQLQARVGQAAGPTPASPRPDDWSGRSAIAPAPGSANPAGAEGGEDGLRLEAGAMFEDAAPDVAPPPPRPPRPEPDLFRFDEDLDEAPPDPAAGLDRQFRRVARQAALDPDDGLEL